MKKKELLKRIEALEKQVDPMRSLQVANACIDAVKDIAKSIEELDSNCDAEKVEQFNKYKPEEYVIYVPDGVLNKWGSIKNGNYLLWSGSKGWDAAAYKDITPSKPNQFKLVPCKREELKAGDVAFRNDLRNPDFTMMTNYCTILDEGYQYWCGKSCLFGYRDWTYWYKVVEA